MPPAIAADCCELPGELTRKPCPRPPVPPLEAVDEAAASVEVVDIVSCMAEVDSLVETPESDETASVLVT